MSTRELVNALDSDPKSIQEIFSGRRFIYFKLTPTSLLDQAEYRTEIDPQLAQLITGGGVSHVISQPNGQPAFEVYSGRFAEVSE